MTNKAYGNPYAKSQKHTLKPREIEAHGLLEASRRLSAALEDPQNKEKMDQALDFQWRLWTLFQTEALRPDFAFPENVRINILELCAYVDKVIFDFMMNREENIPFVKSFIEINRNLAQGFLQKAEEAPNASMPSESLKLMAQL